MTSLLLSAEQRVQEPDRRDGQRCDGKHVKAEWLPTILTLAPPAQRMALLEAIAIPAGYYVQARPQMTPEQQLEHLRRAVGRMAPAVLEMADKEMGR